MSGDGADKPETAKWDPGFHQADQESGRPDHQAVLPRRGSRSGVHARGRRRTGGVESLRRHVHPDVLVFAPAFYEKFGFDRPVYTLGHNMIFMGPIGDWLHRAGVIEANRENAAKALRDGAVVLVFPGGDYDSYRPTLTENVIDFGGRTGYVRTAIEAGVPIVPMVSIGGQETQLFLARGDSIARTLGPEAAASGDSPDQHRLPVRPVGVLPAESAAARQDRDSGARADRHRGGVRRRSGRRKWSTCTSVR